MGTVMEAPLTLDDVCRLMGVSRVTIWAWTRDGRFPKPLRIGKRRRYWSRETVQAFLTGRRELK
jgi:excisionase family DNA binding protein